MDIEEVGGKSGTTITIGDNEYKLRDITVGDHIAFLGVLKEEQRQDAKRLLIELKEAGLKDEVIASEYRKSLNELKLQPVDLGGAIQTLRGVRYYFWRALIDRVKLEDVNAFITEENWTIILVQMDCLFPVPQEKKKEAEQKPA